jgi:hypothetical protein
MHLLLIGGPRRTNGHEHPIKREHMEHGTNQLFHWPFIFRQNVFVFKKERDHLLLQGKCRKRHDSILHEAKKWLLNAFS